MTKHINELQFEKVYKDELGENAEGFVVIRNEKTEEVRQELAGIDNAIARDQAVSAEQLIKLENLLGEISVDVDGDKVPLSVIKKISNFKEALDTCRHLVKRDKPLSINDLTWLTPDAANVLLGGEFNTYILRNVRYITPKIAQIICEHNPAFVELGVVDLTEETAKALGQFRGDGLILNQLAHVPLELIKGVAPHIKYLVLNGVKSLPDKTLINLSEMQGELVLDELTELSDTGAMSLQSHSGKLWLQSLRKISDKGLSALAEHGERVYVSPELEPRLRLAYENLGYDWETGWGYEETNSGQSPAAYGETLT